jgi:hypothetical protein
MLSPCALIGMRLLWYLKYHFFFFFLLLLPVLFADDILIFDKNPMNFKFKTNRLFFKINEWFERNLSVINYEKTCFTQFQNKNCKSLDIQVE